MNSNKMRGMVSSIVETSLENRLSICPVNSKNDPNVHDIAPAKSIPIAVLSKKLIGHRRIRRSILVRVKARRSNLVDSTIGTYYLLCSTRPALRHMNSMLIARSILRSIKRPVRPETTVI